MKVSDKMYPNNYYKNMGYNMYPGNNNYKNNNGDRFVGGFLGPFLLGGITGGLLAPSFYPRPIYPPVVYPAYPVYPVPYYR